MKKLLLGIFIMAGTIIQCEDTGEIFDTFKNNRPYYLKVESSVKTRIKMDLNGDGDKDNISFFVTGKKENSSILIRVEDKEIKADKTGEIVKKFILVDADRNDKFIDFGFICSKEDGTNPSIQLYRYNKKKKIVELNEKPLNFIMEGVSGNGKIYFWEGMIYRTGNKEIDENDVLRYYDIEKDKIVENKIKEKDRRYENDWEMVVYKDEEDIIEKDPITEEEKIEIAEREKILAGTLKKWDKYEILKVEKRTDHVKIKMYDGKVGWIGGNHMMWEEME